MNSNEQPVSEVVRGIVVPTAWGAGGEPRLVAILTPDEGEYDVTPVAAGTDLLSHLRDEVEARTVVKTDQKGRKTVTVVSFTVVGVLGEESDAEDRFVASRSDEFSQDLTDDPGGRRG